MANLTTIGEQPQPAERVSGPSKPDLTSGPVVIEARGVSKTFRIPERKVDTLKERALHPFARIGYRELHALQDLSFDVHKGEFFGILGRNGSGKSTLLKIIASIYGADSGRVRMAGQMATFIELGVGFNPELTARENNALNGVLMGLSRREAARRLDEVLDFAELREFVDLKIKNYSSGMMVRLAFAIMIQADADIMLIDEVLAVGDAAFGDKCMDVFQKRRDAGRTIVLVTHDTATVQGLCHRAMTLHDGTLEFIGDPDGAVMRYLQLNFNKEAAQAGEAGKPPPELAVDLDLNARLIHARLLDADGTPIENVEQGQPIRVDIAFEAARELLDPIFVTHVHNADGTVVFGFTKTLKGLVAEGKEIRLAGEIENRLVAGKYSMSCWIRRDREGRDMLLQPVQLLEFKVFGTAPRHGMFLLNETVEPVAGGR